MGDPLPTQEDAFAQMYELKHHILAAEHPFTWSKPGFRFLTFANVQDFEKHVQKQKDVAWVNEIILAYDTKWRDMMGAIGCPVHLPRLCFDVDYYVPGQGGDPEQFKEIMTYIKYFVQIVVRRYLKNADLELEFIEMDGSRQDTPRKYKHSIHMVVANVALENWKDGHYLYDDIVQEWKENETTKDMENPLDRSVFTRNRGMRVQGSRKNSNCPQLSSEHAFEDTLITHYTREDVSVLRVTDFCSVHSHAAKALKRKRCMSVSDGSDKRHFGEHNVHVEALQQWLDTNPLPKSMQWTGANIQEAYTYDTCDYIWFKVGFSQKGIPHLCAGGHQHNGNAAQSWKVRLDKRTMELYAACWPNGKWELSCQSATGELKYLPIKGPKGKMAKLLN